MNARTSSLTYFEGAGVQTGADGPSVRQSRGSTRAGAQGSAVDCRLPGSTAYGQHRVRFAYVTWRGLWHGATDDQAQHVGLGQNARFLHAPERIARSGTPQGLALTR